MVPQRGHLHEVTLQPCDGKNWNQLPQQQNPFHQAKVPAAYVPEWDKESVSDTGYELSEIPGVDQTLQLCLKLGQLLKSRLDIPFSSNSLIFPFKEHLGKATLISQCLTLFS